MWRRFSRRSLLATLAAAPALRAVETAHAQRSDASQFVPAANAYGFRNWSSNDQYFEAPPDPTQAAVRERVRTMWRDQAHATLDLNVDQLSQASIDLLATQLRLAVVQRAGTNGHCYGMVLTAQRYFEHPETIPVEQRLASEIDDPTVPIGNPQTPVYDEIVNRQADQFLRFDVWLGRRAMLFRDWIDTAAILRDVSAVVDQFGTAALMLFNESRFAHQVLAYGVEDRGDHLLVPVYDPNLSASAYHDTSAVLRFDRDGDTVTMRPYGRYTGVLFNRYDRIEDATNRDAVTLLDHVSVDRETIRASLFPLALIVATTDEVELAVVDPDGDPFGRTRGTHMDTTRGAYPRVRSRYGAGAGTYRVSVFGTDATEYDLTATVADTDGGVTDTTVSASIGAGEVHEYDLEIGAESGSLRRRRSGAAPGHLLWAGAGGAAVGVLGYHAARQVRGDEGP